METDRIVSPPSSITSTTTGSTLTDILQLSSSTTSLTTSSPLFRSSSSVHDDDDVKTKRKVNRSSISTSQDGDDHYHVDGHCCSDIGVNLSVGDDGLFILTPMDSGKGANEDTSLSIDECKICYQEIPITHRPCCDYVTCVDCLRQYFASQVEMGSMRIECINVQCHTPIDPEEIASNLDTKLRDIYLRLLQESNCNLTSKTCPACSTMYTLKSSQQLRTMKKIIKKDPSNSRVKCPECKYFWCFLCHAPWHQGLTCGQYRQGDRLLKVWAKQLSQGQLNAQRCPKCKTFIQKSGGCDHMHCNRCKTGFCYRCGEPLRRLKFFGDHYSKFSIFGCKYRYKKENPIQRKAIRGAVFASKLFLAPILGSLIFCAGTLFVSVAVAFLPFYGVITIYKKYSPN